tara:strand:- start:2386 stop:3753 length:1368 start_codon:yes stop_codon:yes gene_type:complete
MGTPIEPIAFKLDISASDTCGNKTFFISGTDRTTYSSNNDFSFNGYIQQLYYEIGDIIEVSFNSNSNDISFIIFNPNNIDISFIFDKNNPNYTISFDSYDNYKFGDSSLNAYGIFNSYIFKTDTRSDLNEYISSKYNTTEIRNRLQKFNRDDRRFIGNFNYIKSDSTRLGVDSSGINNDLIIQSVTNDIHIVAGEKQQTSIWGNLRINGNINCSGKILKQVVDGTNYDEEDLYINNLNIGQYLYNKYDASFRLIDERLFTHDSSLDALDIRVNNHDSSLNVLQEHVNNHDSSLNVLQEHVSIHDSSLATLDTITINHDSSLSSLESKITFIDNSLNLLDFDTSYISYYYFDLSYNALIDEISNITIDPANLNIIPSQIDNSGKLLTTDGSNLYWLNLTVSGELVIVKGDIGPIGPIGPTGISSNLTGYEDASFANVDISDDLTCNIIKITGKLIF